MPRRPTWPPRIHRHATGQARVHYRGQDYYLGPHGSAEAQAAYADLLVRLAAGDFLQSAPAAAPTVLDVCTAYLAAMKADGRDLHCHRQALAPVCRLHGNLPAADFDDLCLEKVRAAMVDGSWMNEAEKDRHAKMRWPTRWCRLTINRHVGRIRTAWRWAERQKMAPRGSWANLRTLPPLKKGQGGVRETPRRRGTRRADLERVLPFIQRMRRHRPVKAMLELQFILGCRSGEICVMRPCDLDRESGPLIGGVKVWFYRPMKHKTEHLDLARVIAVGPAAQALLAPWLEHCSPEQFVFRTGRGAAYSVKVYDACVWRACRKAGVHVLPYGGRHSLADRAKKAYGLEGAKAVLGHSSIEQTNAYGEQIDMEKAAEIAARLG